MSYIQKLPLPRLRSNALNFHSYSYILNGILTSRINNHNLTRIQPAQWRSKVSAGALYNWRLWRPFPYVLNVSATDSRRLFGDCRRLSVSEKTRAERHCHGALLGFHSILPHNQDDSSLARQTLLRKKRERSGVRD